MSLEHSPLDRRAIALRAIGVFMRTLQVQSECLIEKYSRSQDMHPTDFTAMCHIIDAELRGAALTASQLQDRLRLTSGAVTAVVDRLARAGCVRRERGAIDRRQIVIHFEPRAREVGGTFAGPLVELTDRLGQAFTEEELEVVTRFLQGMSEGFTSLLDEQTYPWPLDRAARQFYPVADRSRRDRPVSSVPEPAHG